MFDNHFLYVQILLPQFGQTACPFRVKFIEVKQIQRPKSFRNLRK
jgi:hypothetical protein